MDSGVGGDGCPYCVFIFGAGYTTAIKHFYLLLFKALVRILYFCLSFIRIKYKLKKQITDHYC